jgi:cation transport ATPase
MRETRVLEVEGTTCARCERRVRSALRAVPGVLDVQADWRKGRCQVWYLSGSNTEEDLIQAIEAASPDKQHRFSAKLAVDGKGSLLSDRRGASSLLIILAALPCLLLCGGAAVILPAVAGFLAGNLIGVVPGLALGALFGLGTWWVVRRRRKECATCLNRDREGAKP